MIADLGSGPWPNPLADVHVDINGDYPHVEVVHDLLQFPYPFEDASADTIFLHDVVEHITILEIPDVFRECYRILKPGGALDIVCPDVDWVIERLKNNDWKEKAVGEWLHQYPTDFLNAMRCLFGGSYDDNEYKKKEMWHVAGYNQETLEFILRNSIMPNMWVSMQRLTDDRSDSILRLLVKK